jgi:hypothetical protein
VGALITLPLFGVVAIASGTALLALALGTRTRWLQRQDDRLEEHAGPLRQHWRRIAGVATLTGEKFVHPVIGALTTAAVLFARHGDPLRVLLPLASASLGGITVHHLVKFVYHRPRPLVALPVAIVLALALCLATGASRVALGWHWGTDVLGGWFAGVGIASLCAQMYVILL